MIPLSLTNKYFINTITHPGGQQSLMRGRILGPVHEMFPAYLCELHPADADALAVRNQILVPLDQLMGIYLYDDREIWLLEWARLKHAIDDGRKTERIARAVQRRKRAMEKKLADAGITMVEADPSTVDGLRTILASLGLAPMERAGLPQSECRADDAESLQQPETQEQDDQDADDDFDRRG